MTSEPVPITRALLSVSDKTGLIELARDLVARGVEIEPRPARQCQSVLRA